jgi:hypothetical protein
VTTLITWWGSLWFGWGQAQAALWHVAAVAVADEPRGLIKPDELR